MLSRQSISFTFFVLTNLFFLSVTAQNSMGIGTDTPNQNAVLELVSPTGNQGFLVPRYTTVERTATSFTSNLSATDNGLMVFDTNESSFYVWVETQWQAISNQAVSAGAGISIDGSGAISNTGDLDNSNEIQDLNLISDVLTITNNVSATNIDLSPYTDTQLTESEVDGFVANNGYLVSEVDGSITNEIQDLDLTSDILTITNNGSATDIDLTPYLDDTNTQLTEAEVDGFVANNGYLIAEVDGSVTNEIQDLDLTSDILTITNNGSASNIDLTPYLDNIDAQDAASVPYNNTVVSYLAGENVQDALDELAINFNDVGNPSGTTISDNTDVLTALQELETAVEIPASISLQQVYSNGATIFTSGGSPFTVSGSEAISLDAGSGNNLSLSSTGSVVVTGGNFSVTAAGNVTASDYQYSSTVSKRITIGVHQFRPEILTGDVDGLVVAHGNGAIAQPFISGNSDPDSHLSAPVSLPNGAVLTLFEAQLYQSPSSANGVMMQLYRKSLAGAPELMSTVTYSTTPGTTQLVSDTDFGGFEVVDNTNYQYWLRFTGEGGDGLLSYTAGVRFTYTIISLD